MTKTGRTSKRNENYRKTNGKRSPLFQLTALYFSRGFSLSYTSCYTSLHPLQIKFYIWYEVEASTTVSPSQKIIINDVINAATWLVLHFTDQSAISLIWKMSTLVNFFYQGNYLWKFYLNTTSRSQDITWSLFYQQIMVCP